MNLSPHNLKIALLQPQIAPNTGNIARLCVATGTELHLVRPMGFVLSDKALKRAAMDYWPRLKLTVHDDTDVFVRHLGADRAWLLENGESRSIWQTDFCDGDWLIFGSETAGTSPTVRERFSGQCISIPQVPGERCLNLSTAAGMALGEALRKIRL
jgi:tRNA (cytidine/uridine-2'-O-)-methyltransferase